MASKQIVVAFWGFEGSGKNYTASLLEKEGFAAVSFAENLKRCVAVIFGWEYEMLEGITNESRIWREQVDEFWSKELNMPKLTPRQVLQKIGTDAMRNHFHEGIWVASLKRKLALMPNTNIVITDCRFPSEADEIRKWGGHVIAVERRSAIPSWYDMFIELKCTPEEFYKSHKVHPAETSMIGYPHFSGKVRNDGDCNDLFVELFRCLRNVSPKQFIKKIAFDFDDVLLPFLPSFVKFYNRTRRSDLTTDEFQDMRIAPTLGISEEEARELFDEFVISDEHEEMHNLKPTKACKETIGKLKKQYDLVVVTARESRFEKITKQYLDKHFPSVFEDAIFCGFYRDGVSKLEICLQLNCHALVDDSPHHLDLLEKTDIIPITFGNYPWNVQRKGIRTPTWASLETILL